MRGLDVVLLILCMVIALPVVAALTPWYNNGAGLDEGGMDKSGMNAFNWTALQTSKPTSTGNAVVDVAQSASYYFNMAIMAITGVVTLLFSAIPLATGLLSMFGVNPVLVTALLALFAIVMFIAWWQIIKGDDWSGRR